MTPERNFAIVNYSRGKDGTAIAAKIYYDVLTESGYHPSWYQFADRFDINDYMQFPTVFPGSGFPINSVRPGWDRMVFFPSRRNSIREKKIFLADPTLIRVGKGKDFMVKVHDINPLTKYREKWTSWAMFKYSMPRLKLANSVIVTTRHMKEIIAGYCTDEQTISIVPEPVYWDSPKKYNNQKPPTLENGKSQILYVAADRPYKNIIQFLNIAAEFQKKGLNEFEFTLVSRVKESTLEYFKSLNLSNTKILRNVPDMKEIYSKSHILVYPSLYEGFGRPIVEAMSYGIPTISLDIQPFREIIGDDGTLLDGNNVSSWVEAIQSISERARFTEMSLKAKSAYNNRFSETIFKTALKKAFEAFLER